MQRDQEYQDGHWIAVIHKSAKQEIRVSLCTFRGRTFGDIRLFVPNQQGEWIPTRKGCTFAVEQLAELECAVQKLRGAAEESALLFKVIGWRPPARKGEPAA